MLLHILVGAVGMGAIWFLVGLAKNRQLTLKWWQWIITVLGVLYAVFVLEVVLGFLGENAPQAALVMGMVTAIPAVIWFVLLFRFVFVAVVNEEAR